MTRSDRPSLIRERVRELRQRAANLGLGDDEFKLLFNMDPTERNYNKHRRVLKIKLLFRKLLSHLTSFSKFLFSKKLVFAFLLLSLGFLIYTFPNYNSVTILANIAGDQCLVDWPMSVQIVFRPQMPCGLCQNLKTIPIVHNLTKEEFAHYFAYTGVPVLIKGAITNWRALQNFDYQYFKGLYNQSADSLKDVDKYCQFFPSETEFESLGEVFEMPDDRAALKNGTKPWYIGWSNCNDQNEVGTKLRAQYSRPYFLPKHSSNMKTDWIFMGGPGHGFAMHIDDVGHPSWQAQISGSKTWILDPSPECWDKCKRLEVTVEKGDILVVDTNIWYHSTKVNHGNISVTIGAEYD